MEAASIVRLSALISEALSELGLEEAKEIAVRAEARGKDMGVPVCVALCDAGGNEILFHRMAGALPASTELARNKAWSAAAFRMSTQELGKSAQPGAPLYGVNAGHNGRVVLFGGGLPIRRSGRLIGAIGVSGGTVDEDICVASHAIAAVK